MHPDRSTDAAAEHEQLSHPKPNKILLNRADLKSLGITFSNAHLLRLEFYGTFPRRIRLAGASVCWDRDEVMAWIEARKVERASWHYADPS